MCVGVGVGGGVGGCVYLGVNDNECVCRYVRALERVKMKHVWVCKREREENGVWKECKLLSQSKELKKTKGIKRKEFKNSGTTKRNDRLVLLRFI